MGGGGFEPPKATPAILQFEPTPSIYIDEGNNKQLLLQVMGRLAAGRDHSGAPGISPVVRPRP